MFIKLAVHAGFTLKEAQEVALSGACLAYCCTDMASIGELQITEFLGEAKHASGGSDTSNKGNKEFHTPKQEAKAVTQECTEQQTQDYKQACTLFCGHIMKVGKDLKHAAAAVTCKLEEISKTAAAL
jgi:hypothetical protein